MEKIERRVRSLDEENTPDVKVTQQKLNDYGLTDITLRSYQLDGINWLINCYKKEHGCILGDEMGLGKTCQTISLLVYLVGSGKGLGPHLVLSPLSVLNNWKTELARFAPHLKVLSYVGDKNTREELRNDLREKIDNIHVVLTTYETCLKDETYLKKYSWHTLVVDEAHRLKNRESLLHIALSEFDTEHTVLLTGTPVQNNLTELYSLLHFIVPEIFKVKYVEEFLETFDDVASTSKKINKLHDLLLPFILRRVKSQVIKDLPDKSEMILFHGMTALQKEYYKAILMKDTSIFKTSSSGSRTKLMNVLMQLRKCVNHPYLFEGVEPEPFELGEHLVEASGKLVLIDQLLTYLQPRGHKVLLFSQMTRMLDILQDYLGFRGINYERLDGSIRGEERYLAVQNFNTDDDTFVFLLSTKAGGQGLNLVSADTVIFVDSDFNPQNDLQAAARAHRIGQTRPVKVIRLIGRSTVDEIILKRAEAKLKLTETVIEQGNFSLGADVSDKEALITNSKFQIQDILKFGVDRLFSNDESTLETVDFDQILGRSENGAWTEKVNKEEQATLAAASMETDVDDDENHENEKKNKMYVYEGTDYSQLADEDVEAFDKLLIEKDAEEDEDEDLEGHRGRRGKGEPGTSKAVIKPRKKLTPEQLEERRKRRAELAAQRKQEEEEDERRRAEKRKNRLLALWKKNNYTSVKMEVGSDEEESSDEDESEEESEDGAPKMDINYVVGDVTKPQIYDDKLAYVVHCVDDSGGWGSGGVFSALSKISSEPKKQYEQAGKMKDLSLGDVHLVPLETDDDKAKVHVALVIAQTRNRKGVLTGIKLHSLSEALKAIAQSAKKNKASIHLPRIGHNTPGFNWYGTERLLRKCLVSKGIKTCIYYFKQRQPVKRIISSDESEDETPNKKVGRSPPAKPSTSKESKPAVEKRRQPVKRIISSDESGDEGPNKKVHRPPAAKPSTSKESKPAVKKGGQPVKGIISSDESEDEGPNKKVRRPPPAKLSTPKESKPAVFKGLPDFMSGIAVYFHEISPSTKKCLSRYLIAYDGDVCESVSDATTHIVTEPDQKDVESQELQDSKEYYPAVSITTTSWLRKCIRSQKKLDPT